MALISFTRQFRDRSDVTGFRFEFWCDLCSTGHMTQYQYDPLGVASSLASVASTLLGRWSRVGNAGKQMNQLLRGKAWEDAHTAAVEEAKQFFKHCTRCNLWTCPENCWNGTADMCRRCAPVLAKEAVAMQNHAGKFQMWAKAMSVDQTGPRELSEHQVANCPHCGGLNNAGGNYCVDCGKQILMRILCTSCGNYWSVHENFKFCPTCGTSLTLIAEVAKEAAERGKEAEAKTQAESESQATPKGQQSKAQKARAKPKGTQKAATKASSQSRSKQPSGAPSKPSSKSISTRTGKAGTKSDTTNKARRNKKAK